MSPHAKLRLLIGRTERLLPGRPAPDGEKDSRWQAIIKIGAFIETQPEPVWEFIDRWGRHPRADLRTAIGVCLLEHLLEHHFADYFPKVETAVRSSKRFRDTLAGCFWFGEAALPANARRLDRLAGVKRQRLHPRKPGERKRPVFR